MDKTVLLWQTNNDYGSSFFQTGLKQINCQSYCVDTHRYIHKETIHMQIYTRMLLIQDIVIVTDCFLPIQA
jgi:hypothetical protein